MFAPPSSNKTVSITVSENGGFVIAYYDELQGVQTQGGGAAVPPRFQQKILTASTTEEVCLHLTNLCNRLRQG
ncbi:MAG: hypothetical protein K8I29_19515 [Alphaproteobacteria bacterium]|uniref:Uncharacterized protein n=1 Tax=Candidatus Nitrobium versatile TaxID=2884831 RepID=A0A953M3N9_9BACT|nr:hypothetical protein [Candidatus Nitrobium versatile]